MKDEFPVDTAVAFARWDYLTSQSYRVLAFQLADPDELIYVINPYTTAAPRVDYTSIDKASAVVTRMIDDPLRYRVKTAGGGYLVIEQD